MYIRDDTAAVVRAKVRIARQGPTVSRDYRSRDLLIWRRAGLYLPGPALQIIEQLVGIAASGVASDAAITCCAHSIDAWAHLVDGEFPRWQVGSLDAHRPDACRTHGPSQRRVTAHVRNRCGPAAYVQIGHHSMTLWAEVRVRQRTVEPFVLRSPASVAYVPRPKL
jgi:hypothetical protein